MANRRMIWQDFFEDEYFGSQPRDVRLMWVGLIVSVADDQGRMLYNPSLIGSKVFLYDRDIPEDLIDKWLIALVDAGKLLLYVKEGKHLLQIVKWWDYQSPSWAMPSRFPAPDEWKDRVRRYAGNRKIETLNWDDEGGLDSDDKPENKKDSGEVKQLEKINDNTQIIFRLKDKDLYDQIIEGYNLKKGKKQRDSSGVAMMVDEFEKKGVTLKDFLESIDERDADGRYPGETITVYKTWTLNKINDKGKNGKGKEDMSPKDYKKSWGKQ